MQTYETIIAFDIETAPITDEAAIDRMRANLKPPGNYKKQDSIDEWYRTQGAQALEEQVARTALDGMRGDVIAVGWIAVRVYQNGSVERLPIRLHVRARTDTVKPFLSGVLEEITTDALAKPPHLVDAHMTGLVFAGHNIVGFDLPFLWQQAVRHDVPWPRLMPHLPSPWDGRVLDTMTALVGARNTVSLADACAACGVVFEDDTPSAQVPVKWAAGDYVAVEEHLRNDVRATLGLALRIRNVLGGRHGDEHAWMAGEEAPL